MKKLTYLLILINLLSPLFAPALQVHAVSTTAVISEIDPAGSKDKVEITNTSSQLLDARGWKLNYVPASGNNPRVVYQFDEVRGLAPEGVITLKTSGVSEEADDVFVGGLAEDAGTLQLVDAQEGVIDTVGWAKAGKAVAIYEGAAPAVAPKTGESIARSNALDTDENSSDFTAGVPDFAVGGWLEVVDLCSNIEGVQATVPTGYEAVNGVCTEASQSTEPTEEPALPAEFTHPYLTELLPDPGIVSDNEGEFIEIYNPNTTELALAGYQIKVGSKIFTFTSHVIAPQSYLAIYSAESKLGLSNSGSSAQLYAPNETDPISQTPQYEPVDPDQSFAFFADGWKLTDEPTPGLANIWRELSDEEVAGRGASSTATECPAGKYRNPETNRCRNIESAATAVKPCDEGEYRSPETNRCRKVAAATTTITPCKAGYERNLETNRCRKLDAAAAAPAPCKPGYERNTETNRCRKIPAPANPATLAAAQPAGLNLWLAGAGISAIGGYGIWEWRREILGFARKFWPGAGSE